MAYTVEPNQINVSDVDVINEQETTIAYNDTVNAIESEFDINSIYNDTYVQDVIIFPNPTTGIFHIHINEKFENVNILIFSSVGKLVFKMYDLNSNKLTVDISDNQTGIYTVKTITKENVFINKIILK